MSETPPNISGTTHDGDYIRTLHLRHPQGTRASIVTLGARLIDFRLPDTPSLTLSFSSLAGIEADPAYVGVAVGRTANRIRGGTLRAGPKSTLECNEHGQNHTHGGRRAYDKRLFAVAASAETWCELFLFSPDGDQGYPESIEVTVRYEVTHNALEVLLRTKNLGNGSTITNMTLHPYFDLNGNEGKVAQSALQYELQAPDCESYLVLDEQQVPTGEISSVNDTRFDFRIRKTLGEEGSPQGYDQYFVTSATSSLDGPLRKLATIAATRLEMDVWSNQPGFQLYTANGFDGRDGGFACQGSIAVEPSGYIDAGNHESFPSIILQAGETRNQRISYRFRAR